jgi:ATP-dependent Clp protease adaptor protein ClpS
MCISAVLVFAGVYSFEIAESKAQKTIDYARKNDHPLQLQLEKE